MSSTSIGRRIRSFANGAAGFAGFIQHARRTIFAVWKRLGARTTAGIAHPAAVLIVMSCAGAAPTHAAINDMSTSTYGHRVRFSIALGEHGLAYAGLRTDERPWGPTALKIDDAGTAWVADGVSNRLLRFDLTGVFLGALDLNGAGIVSPTDFALHQNEVLVLDTSSQEPALHRLALDGTPLEFFPLPADSTDITGLQVADDGTVSFELRAGEAIERVRVDQGRAELAGEAPKRVRVGVTNTKVRIARGKRARSLTFRHGVGAALLAHKRAEEHVLVHTMERVVGPTGALEVDEVVHAFDRSLLATGRARLDPGYAYIAHPLSVGPDTKTYYLLSLPDSIQILELRFDVRLPARIAPYRPEEAAPAPISPTAHVTASMITPLACVSRTTMLSRAAAYPANSTSYSDKNINGACSGRTKPSYLGSPGVYKSVAYSWGGWPTISSYNSAIAAGKPAGDVDTTYQSCAVGIDCSGYISRIWGLTSKHSTSMLDGVSTRLTGTSALMIGDVMNWSGQHVVMFAKTGSNGAYFYESTAYRSYDRVVYAFSSWSRFSGYTPRRFTNVCSTNTSATAAH